MKKNILNTIEPQVKLPQESKKEVMNTVRTTQLVFDFLELFVIHSSKVTLNLIEDNNKNTEP